MTITLPASELHTYLLTTSQLIPKRPAMPVLACVHIAYHDHAVVCTTTYLETTVICHMQSTSDTGMAAGALCIPHADLLAFCGALPKDSAITITPTGKKALVSGTSASAKLPTIDPDYWPAPHEHHEVTTLALLARDLLEGLIYGGLARATNDARPVLTGMYIHGHADGLCFESADGFALSRYVLPIDAMPAFDPIIAPSGWCERAIAVLKGCKSDAPADIMIGTHSVMLVAGGMQIASRLIDGSFPKVDTFLQPEDTMPRFAIEAIELQRLKGIIGLAMCEGDKAMPALWHASENSFVAYASNGDTFVSADVTATVHYPEGQPWLAAFDLARLLLMVSVSRASEVHARHNQKRGALLLSFHERHSGYLAGIAHIGALGFKYDKSYADNAAQLRAAIDASERQPEGQPEEEELFPEDVAA